MMKKKKEKLFLVTMAAIGNDVLSTLTAFALLNARKMQSRLGGVQRLKAMILAWIMLKDRDIRRAEDWNSRFEFTNEKESESRRFGGAITLSSIECCEIKFGVSKLQKRLVSNVTSPRKKKRQQ
jgi:hypothetical protein